MNNSNKVLVGILIVVLIAFGGYALMHTQSTSDQTPVSGGTPGTDHYNLETFYNGFWKANGTATSTSGTAVTLKSSDIYGFDFISVTPNKGAVTITFPASSTLPSFLPKAGMEQKTCFYNATSTAAATITFVAGTGIDIEIASSTSIGAGALVGAKVPSNSFACMTFIRKPATAAAFDIGILYTQFTDAD